MEAIKGCKKVDLFQYFHKAFYENVPSNILHTISFETLRQRF